MNVIHHGHQVLKVYIYIFDNMGIFLKKSPLDSPLVSKTYGQLTTRQNQLPGQPGAVTTELKSPTG